jgi:hypothetical protein
VWRQTLAVARLFAESSVDAGVYRASSLVGINADAGFKASKNMATRVTLLNQSVVSLMATRLAMAMTENRA